MAVIAAILFAIGLVLRFVVAHADLKDPWVWAFAGLLCLALAGVLPLTWPRR
jgi:hypothetical protein